MLSPINFQQPKLTRAQKNKLLQYAEQILRAEQQMINPEKGHHLLHHTLENHHTHRQNKHYPEGDRIDKTTGAQYFYHCHREDYEQEEHGHFHCFMRYANISKNIKPRALPDWDKYINNPMTHLVAIAMNRYGKPIRLFTTNRWVTSEIYYDAKHTKQLLSQFKLTLQHHAHWVILDQWVEGMLHLFSPQIICLCEARDNLIKHQLLTETNIKNIYTDKRFSELSTLPINLEQQIQWLLG